MGSRDLILSGGNLRSLSISRPSTHAMQDVTCAFLIGADCSVCTVHAGAWGCRERLPENDIARHTNRISPTIFFPGTRRRAANLPRDHANCGDETKLYLVVSYESTARDHGDSSGI